MFFYIIHLKRSELFDGFSIRGMKSLPATQLNSTQLGVQRSERIEEFFGLPETKIEKKI